MSTHTDFIHSYCKLYEQHFGGPYLFQGGKDAAAVKRFTAAGINLDDAMKILQDSFTRSGYPYDNTCTIAGFISAWPRLLADRAKKNNSATKQSLTRWDLQRQIEYVKEAISSHVHNPESIHENRDAIAEVSLPELRRKLDELKLAYARL